ncbi:MAG: MFS transporter [Candidatus Binataceae bacterium]
MLVIGLGITWVLDGLEITLMGAISAVLQRPNVLDFSASEIGFISSCYLAGAVLGALVFGHLTDRFGRRRFFFLSLGIYLCGVALTAISWNLVSFALFRFITGMGIGGEYAAVNSAIDELIPARLRGRVDLIVNGSYWLGAAAGAASTVILLDPHVIAQNIGWRLGFGLGAVIGLVIIYLRGFIPESPRWLLTHGQREEAEKIVREVEDTVARETGERLGEPREKPLKIHVRHQFGLAVMLKPLVTQYRTRSILGLSLMIAQAFVYNAILFTYAIVLTRFYGVRADHTGFYLLPFALGNFLGPVLLGHLFDTIGRRTMIAATFALSGLLLILTGWLFSQGMLTTFTQSLLWTVMFFFASPAASSAYLTVSEIFPLEMRALAISIFYALGTATGGIISPWFFGKLIDTGQRIELAHGYMVAAGLMLGAAIVEVFFGVSAERKSLEEVAAPLSSAS